MTNKLKAAMIGGGQGAFIGAVHRKAMALDGQIDLVAGALSADPDRALASGRELGLSRIYPSWQAMLEAEQRLPPDERIDFVSIVTPNHTHFEIARAFAQAGFHIACDKPLCTTSDQARQLIAIAETQKLVFAVTYNYSGYPLVKQARHMVRSGALGDIRKVVVEYTQGWLSSPLERTGHKQAAWRADPATAGIGGAIADIGSHAEHLLHYITGLEIDSLCADLTTFIPGRLLDDDASILLRFKGGARGAILITQVAQGYENDLAIRIHGTSASLAWRQQDPNQLLFRPESGPDQVIRRGHPYLCPEAQAATRLPPGHPEGFIEAFANIYLASAAAIRSAHTRPPSAAIPDYPTVLDGARGVWTIEKCVQSSRSGSTWVGARFPA
jgi:predicted dehydrogenase